MARNFNKYQYETSPRKLVPDYTTPQRNEPKKRKSTARKNTNKSTKKVINKKEKELKIKQIKTTMYLLMGFAIIFGICLRNAQIDESFEEVQSLKEELKEINKENSQLEIAIENAVNINNIEQQAKERLGMQKLTSKQTTYIELQKSDYISSAAENVIIEEENFFQKALDVIMNLFK